MKYKDWYLATTNKNRTGGLIPRNYGEIRFSLSIGLCLTRLLLGCLVEESTEKLVNALHDAAKRANIEFLQQSLANKVVDQTQQCLSFLFLPSGIRSRSG